MPAFDWSVINTSLLLGLAAYLWKQGHKIDRVYQALFGVEGRNGISRRIEALEASSATVDQRIVDSRHMLRNEFTAKLNEQDDPK